MSLSLQHAGFLLHRQCKAELCACGLRLSIFITAERKLDFVLLASQIVTFHRDFKLGVLLRILNQHESRSSFKRLQLLPARH